MLLTKPTWKALTLPNSPDQSRADQTRARLREAAILAFAKKGYHGTTTRDIAAAAGMSSAVLYVHHSSKEELLYILSRAGHEEVLQVITAAATSSEDPVEQLRAVVHAFALHHANSHTSARIVNYELAHLSEEHYQEVLEIRRCIDEVFSRVIRRGLESGALDIRNPRMAVVALQSLGIDIARWYREGGWTPEEVADGYVDVAMRIVGASALTTWQTAGQAARRPSPERSALQAGAPRRNRRADGPSAGGRTVPPLPEQ